jgi:hypothetical protein
MAKETRGIGLMTYELLLPISANTPSQIRELVVERGYEVPCIVKTTVYGRYYSRRRYAKTMETYKVEEKKGSRMHLSVTQIEREKEVYDGTVPAFPFEEYDIPMAYETMYKLFPQEIIK